MPGILSEREKATHGQEEDSINSLLWKLPHFYITISKDHMLLE